MSLMRSGYKRFGLEMVELEKKFHHRPKPPAMEEKKRGDRARYLFNMLLEEALVQQMNEIMDNFSQILLCIPATTKGTSTSNHF